MTLQSQAFKNGEHIPSKYTCEGEDISPPLSWSGAPTETKSFALIEDDPNAPAAAFTHWIIFNIPASENSLPENIPKKARFPYGAIQGLNDFQRYGYGGPCPPPGRMHRYLFQLYAIDAELNLPSGANKQDALKAIESHTLAKAELTGLYSRR